MHLLDRFFSTWRFAVAATSLILCLVGLMAAVLLVPAPPGPAAEFAESFKIWCFGYDPATGTYEWGYVWMFLIQPFVMLGFILMIWGKTLKDARRDGWRRVAPFVLVPCLLVLVGSVAFVRDDAASRGASSAAAFPGERIRTEYRAPAFSLIDHRNSPVALSDLEGRPVLLTAVYTACGTSCPLILREIRRALEGVGHDIELSVVVVTLDPATDTPEVLAALAEAHGLNDRRVHFLTGSVDAVGETLEMYGFGRSRDLKTGVIDHVNQFVLLDASGRVAYRFGLGDLQSTWMAEAIAQLVNEPPSSPSPSSSSSSLKP